MSKLQSVQTSKFNKTMQTDIFRGTDQKASGVIRNPDGTAYNLTDKSIEWFLKKKGQTTILIFKRADISDPPENGGYSFDLSHIETVNIPEAIYEYGILVRSNDMLVYSGGGEVSVRTPGGLS